jgi:hypothetical protein
MKKMLLAGLLAIPLVGLCRQEARAWFCYREFHPHIPIPMPIIPLIKPSFSFSCPECVGGHHCAACGALKGQGGCAHCGWGHARGDSQVGAAGPAAPASPWFNYYPGISSPATGSPYPAANPVYAPGSGYDTARGGQPIPSYWYGH